MRLVLKSPLWLAPVVYLAPLKPIIIIMLLSGSGWDAAIWQWCRVGYQGLHGMLLSARFITCLTLTMHRWRTCATFCLNVLLMRELGVISISLNYSPVVCMIQISCFLPHHTWFKRSSLIPINQNLLYVSLGWMFSLCTHILQGNGQAGGTHTDMPSPQAVACPWWLLGVDEISL